MVGIGTQEEMAQAAFMEWIPTAAQDATAVCKAWQNIATLFLDAVVPCLALALTGTSTFLTFGDV